MIKRLTELIVSYILQLLQLNTPTLIGGISYLTIWRKLLGKTPPPPSSSPPLTSGQTVFIYPKNAQCSETYTKAIFRFSFRGNFFLISDFLNIFLHASRWFYDFFFYRKKNRRFFFFWKFSAPLNFGQQTPDILNYFLKAWGAFRNRLRLTFAKVSISKQF